MDKVHLKAKTEGDLQGSGLMMNFNIFDNLNQILFLFMNSISSIITKTFD